MSDLLGLLVNFGPLLLLAILILMLPILTSRQQKRFLLLRQEQAREMRLLFESSVVPELRGISSSINALTAELKRTKPESAVGSE